MHSKKLRLVLFCGLFVFVVASLQHSNVPLYDGVAAPDEPYRYIASPTHSASKKPPSGATEQGTVTSGFNKDGIYLNTEEQGPQVYASFTQHSFAATEGSIVTINLQPLGGGSTVTPAGKIAGNIYSITAAADKGIVSYAANPQSPSYIDMRLPQGYPVGAIIVYRPATTGAWQQLATDKVGNDIYESKISSLGEYAVASHATPGSSFGRQLTVLVPISILVALLVIIITAIRRSAAKKSLTGAENSAVIPQKSHAHTDATDESDQS